MSSVKKFMAPLAIAALSVFTLGFGTTATQAQTGETASVNMTDNVFVPAATTVTPGTTVTWTNNGANNHTVTADNGTFDSGLVPPGSTYSYTFETAGTYNYYCKIHGAPGLVGMAGTVTVASSTAASNNTATSTPLTGTSTPATTSTSTPSTGTSTPATGTSTPATTSTTTPSTATSTPNTTAPSIPTGLAATIVSPTRVDLSWSASTDPDSPVNGYVIFRNGSQIATSSATTYTDLAPNASSTNPTYMVSAYDAAGNGSAVSPMITVILDSATTTPGTSTTTGTSTPPVTSTSTPLTGTSTPATGTSTPSTSTTTPPTSTSTPETGSPRPGSGPGSNMFVPPADGMWGWIALPASLFNQIAGSSTMATTATGTPASPYQMSNGYPMINGNYVDCYGNIDNDPAHHTTDPNDTDPAHHIGQNCSTQPGGGNMMSNPLFNMMDNGQSTQWITVPLTADLIHSLALMLGMH